MHANIHSYFHPTINILKHILFFHSGLPNNLKPLNPLSELVGKKFFSYSAIWNNRSEAIAIQQYEAKQAGNRTCYVCHRGCALSTVHSKVHSSI